MSACLLGQNVRYDGGHKKNDAIVSYLLEHNVNIELMPFCPEVAIGLGVPRKKIHLVKEDSNIRCVGVEDPKQDVTHALVDCANKDKQKHNILSGFIFKQNSPSCGPSGVKLSNKGSITRVGVGLYVGQVIENYPEMPIEDESYFTSKESLERFILRAMKYSSNRK